MENTNNSALLRISKLFIGTEPEQVIALPPSGSYRRYYRISYKNNSIIGVVNNDYKENLAFITFTRHFFNLGLNVPEVLAENLEENVYLLSDLGDNSLHNYLADTISDGEYTPETIDVYKKVLSQLPLFQVKGSMGLNYNVCYPRAAFDKQSMLWDLNYFKYYFLKLAQVPFDEQNLETDFETLTNYLLQADCNYFLYRDFQSRNVMIFNNEPYFIDYQGGRKGALQYDIASILFEAKTALPPNIREELLEHYLNTLSKLINFDRNAFVSHFYGYVYIRIMQAMGAYGFRGLYEKKELFLQSIPKALDHLQWLNTNIELPVKLPELTKVWKLLTQSEHIKQLAAKAIAPLIVNINSFSYKRGIPIDESLNGGGYVFDCRSLPNPGRFEQYKHLTGKDTEVIEFFKNVPEMKNFYESIFSLINNHINVYSARGFTHLMVNFGCTGGQHRSVYSAEMLAKHIANNYPHLIVNVRHREQEMRK